MCCTIQICAQHGSHNENIPRKVAPKFNWALSGGSFSRLTFQVRRRTCLGGAQVVPPTPAPCTTVRLPRGNSTYYDVLRCPHHLKREILPNGRTWSFVPRDRPLSLESAVMGFADHSFSSSPSSSSPLSSSLSLSYWIFEKMYAKKCK